VRGGEVLVIESGGSVAIPRLEGLEAVGLEAEVSHYLGAFADVHCYAVHLVAQVEAPEGMAFVGLRSALLGLEEKLAGVAGLAYQIVDWDRTHRFCGRCGTPTEDATGERAKRCPACNLHAWPRVSPAVIARVTRGNEILLARGRRFPDPIYSVLAGFVDPGESLEEAVVREIREEVGVEVTDLCYFGSQPWPFPHSLMVGFTARWAGGEIRIDEEELVDAAWFDVDALPPVPPRLSIARRLIDDFVASPSRV
jgi:NAD+ diphosphatase